MNILCIGKSRLKEENNKSDFGISFISSYLLGSWKQNVYYQGIVSKDAFGEKIVKELKSANVKIKYIQKSNTEELKYKEYNFIPEIIFSDGSSSKVISKIFEKYKSAIKLIYVDHEDLNLFKACESSDYIIFTLSVAENITNIKFDSENKDTLEEIFYKIKAKYNKNIILDLEANGTVFENSEKIKLMGKIKAKSSYQKRNKDVFYGALLYGINSNLEIDKSIRIATIAEYLSLKKSDKSIFIPELKEVYEIYSKNK